MRTIGLFTMPKNMALNIFSALSPYYVIYNDKSPISLKKTLSDRFNAIVHSYVWQQAKAFTHYPPHILFESIYEPLVMLSKKKKINAIDIVDIALLIGDVALIEEIMLLTDTAYNDDILNKAIICNSTAALTILENRGLRLTTKHLYDAISYGSVDIVRYGIRQGIVPTKEMLDEAAMYGELPIVRFLVEQCHLIPDESTLHATHLRVNAKQNTFHLIEYINNHLQIAAATHAQNRALR